MIKLIVLMGNLAMWEVANDKISSFLQADTVIYKILWFNETH